MPFLILRKYRTSEEVELTIDNVEGLSVKELREDASSRLEIPLDELSKIVLTHRVRVHLFLIFRIGVWWAYIESG